MVCVAFRLKLHLVVALFTVHLCLTADCSTAKPTSHSKVYPSENFFTASPRIDTTGWANKESTGSKDSIADDVFTKSITESDKETSRKPISNLLPQSETATSVDHLSTYDPTENTTGILGIPLGAECATYQECNAGTAYSECKLGSLLETRRCQCLPAFYQQGSECKSRYTGLDMQCTTNAECEAGTSNSMCKSWHEGYSSCECLPGYEQKLNICSLRKKVSASNCEILNTETPAHNLQRLPAEVTCTCRTQTSPADCPEWTITAGEEQVTIVENRTDRYDLSCSNFLRFDVSGPTRDLDWLKIRCDGGNRGKDFLFIGTKLGQNCTTNEECVVGRRYSHCKSRGASWRTGTCQCLPNYYQLGTFCKSRLPVTGLGSICKNKKDCYTTTWDSECKYDPTRGENTCQCSSGYEESNSICISTGTDLGFQCTTNRECIIKTSGAECKGAFGSTTCQCSAGYERSSAGCRYQEYSMKSFSNHTMYILFALVAIIMVLFFGFCCCRFKGYFASNTPRSTVRVGRRPNLTSQNIWNMSGQQNTSSSPSTPNTRRRAQDLPPSYDDVTKPEIQTYPNYPPPQYSAAQQTLNSQVPLLFTQSRTNELNDRNVEDQRSETQPSGISRLQLEGHNNRAFDA